MSRVSLAVLLCATLACTTYAQSGAGDLLKDDDVADGDDGSGECPVRSKATLFHLFLFSLLM